jgi:hypothetical protein
LSSSAENGPEAEEKGKSLLVTGRGDMELDSVPIAGQRVTITCFTLTDGNA